MAKISRSDANKRLADSYYERAKAFVWQMQDAGPDLIQNKFRCSYSVALLIVEQLEHNGIIGPDQHNRPRKVYEKALH